MEDKLYWIWLSSLVKIPPGKRVKLLEKFGHPGYLWDAPECELRRLPYLTPCCIDQLTDKELRKQARTHLETVFSRDMRMVTLEDSEYPPLLKQIIDPPPVLYVRGNLVRENPGVAVVGSRRATQYGLDTAENLAFQLAAHGVEIISGLARGVDTRAHMGALKAGGATIAVLGCGLDITYPLENKALMKKIPENGAVISELVPGTPPHPINFPARNRIISGLSLGVTVIEASEKSGSLITANYALDQGRDVFAVPGNINCRNSSGTNAMLKDGAKLVTSAGDILEELKITYHDMASNDWNRPQPSLSGLEKEEKRIALCLSRESLHIDRLAIQSGLEVRTVQSILFMLEMKGLVEQLPGKIFRLRKQK